MVEGLRGYWLMGLGPCLLERICIFQSSKLLDVCLSFVDGACRSMPKGLYIPFLSASDDKHDAAHGAVKVLMVKEA